MMSTPPPSLSADAALFLDFDGTLVPLAARPQDIRVPDWVIPTLQTLSERLDGAVAIVSGRPLAQIDAYLAPLSLPAAGSHGAEWRDSAGRIECQVAAPPPSLLEAAGALAAQHDGLILERKPGGFAFHFRARPDLESTCRAVLGDALLAVPGAADDWAWLHGHFVFELRRRGVSKGVAVHRLMAGPPFAGRRAVFVGDDQTDEDGIEVVQARGGHGVRVGGGESQARFRLAGVDAVGAWLAGRH